MYQKEMSDGNVKKTGFYEYVYDFRVDSNATTVDDIVHIHKYLMKKHDIKQCLFL